ncbi:MAG: DUF881 domain-containing protein [Ruminococcaceae bacterium]|nr:DUF881 domain-containing protein [Oscillospiraceae bacterium]
MSQKQLGNNKGKIALIATCALLGFLLMLQFRSVRINQADITSQPARIEQLLERVTEMETRNAQLSDQLEQAKSDIEKMRNAASESGGIVQTMAEQLRRAEVLSGEATVKGPGLVVTLSDSQSAGSATTNENAFVVHDSDLLNVINELRSAGAEALSLNGERILATSEIRCAGNTVSVNNTRYAAPFVIRAIGDSDAMERALMMRSGIVDELERFLIEITIEKSENLVIEGAKNNIVFRYATVVEDES